MELELSKEEKELEEEKKLWERIIESERRGIFWGIVLGGIISIILGIYFLGKIGDVIALALIVVVIVSFLIFEVLREWNRDKEGKSLKSLFKSFLSQAFWLVFCSFFLRFMYTDHSKDNLFSKIIYYVLLTLILILGLVSLIMYIRFKIKYWQSGKKKSKRRGEELKRKYIK